MASNGDDAQRTLEQHALKNVRGLVDNLEAKEAAERRLQKRLLVGFVIVAAVLAVLFATGVFSIKGKGTAKEIVVEPAAPPKSYP